MLQKLLDRQTCAKCQWCCSFDRNDLWETPIIISENIASLQKQFPAFRTTSLGKDYKLDLSEQFKTDHPHEIVNCPFLHAKTGCVLSESEKPFDCKIWPLRIMRKDHPKGESIVLTLTPSCPACQALPIETIRQFAEQEIADVVMNYAEEHPDMIMPYREGYPILVRF